MSPKRSRQERTRRIAELRSLAVELFDVAVDAASPGDAVSTALGRELGGAGDTALPWKAARILAFGKAAHAMADAARRALPATLPLADGIIVTNRGNARPLDGFEVIESGHPLPDEGSVRGAERLAAAARSAGQDDLVIVLVSGGGSALVASPVPGISLADKTRTTELLLASGADIGELNTVRKHLSQLKGGGLARLAQPAAVFACLLSDVIGDDPSTIASGPVSPDPTTFSDALGVLRKYDILASVPASVREHLERGKRGESEETPKPGDGAFERVRVEICGSNRRSLDAALDAARERFGGEIVCFTDRLCGEARQEAQRFVEYAAATIERSPERLAILASGETTVRVVGDGKGGRNQELALAFALAAQRRELDGAWVFLSGGTDGRDGPTDAAGGIVDCESARRWSARRVDAASLLDRNDSHAALSLSGDLLMTGPTGTNVADVQIFLRRG